MAEQEKRKVVAVHFSEDEHTALKLACVQAKVPMERLLKHLFVQWQKECARRLNGQGQGEGGQQP